tara:strand:+ start:681 stop:800 length:120 start_codon:yes stop_codon:yes gene_type:complete
MWLKLLIILVCGAIFAYFANQAFQSEFTAGEAVMDFFVR